jgi:hypothetical protein
MTVLDTRPDVAPPALAVVSEPITPAINRGAARTAVRDLLADDPPERDRDRDGSYGVHYRARQASQAHSYLPRGHRAQRRRDHPRARRIAAEREYGVSTPVNWNEGDEVIISPAFSDNEAQAKFPKGFTTLKPYLRLTPRPNR